MKRQSCGSRSLYNPWFHPNTAVSFSSSLPLPFIFHNQQAKGWLVLFSPSHQPHQANNKILFCFFSLQIHFLVSQTDWCVQPTFPFWSAVLVSLSQKQNILYILVGNLLTAVCSSLTRGTWLEATRQGSLHWGYFLRSGYIGFIRFCYVIYAAIGLELLLRLDFWHKGSVTVIVEPTHEKTSLHEECSIVEVYSSVEAHFPLHQEFKKGWDFVY